MYSAIMHIARISQELGKPVLVGFTLNSVDAVWNVYNNPASLAIRYSASDIPIKDHSVESLIQQAFFQTNYRFSIYFTPRSKSIDYQCATSHLGIDMGQRLIVVADEQLIRKPKDYYEPNATSTPVRKVLKKLAPSYRGLIVGKNDADREEVLEDIIDLLIPSMRDHVLGRSLVSQQ